MGKHLREPTADEAWAEYIKRLDLIEKVVAAIAWLLIACAVTVFILGW